MPAPASRFRLVLPRDDTGCESERLDGLTGFHGPPLALIGISGEPWIGSSGHRRDVAHGRIATMLVMKTGGMANAGGLTKSVRVKNLWCSVVVV